jgi:histidine triad (HIT) family protein
MTDPDCIFCKIVAGEIPSIQIDSDDRTIAFMDINPATRGHVLVIPRRHHTDLRAIDADDLTACTLMAKRVAERVMDKLGADGVNLLNSCGSAAWQTVFHFHMHVIPRYVDDPVRDALKLPWIPRAGDMADVSAAAAELGA